MPAAPQIDRSDHQSVSELEFSHDGSCTGYRFSSPVQVYEFEDWADDDGDDAEEIEWSAGITDFTLFSNDKRRAQESNSPLPSRWEHMLELQSSALERAVKRSRVDARASYLDHDAPWLSDLPGLTPDTSPSLRDNMDETALQSNTIQNSSAPEYQAPSLAAPAPERWSNPVPGDRMQYSRNRILKRPGVRHSRTLSGHVHAWRPPSESMYTVGEDIDAEETTDVPTNTG